MPALSPLGSSVPDNYTFYDYRLSTFTIAQGATGSPYVLTGSQKAYKINTAKNIAATNYAIFNMIMLNISAIRTNQPTDNYAMKLQYSLDGGANWNDVSPPTLSWAGGGVANQMQAEMETVGELTDNYPLTNDEILFRVVISDATSPTTDAATFTNIRVTAFMTIMK